MKLIDMFQDEIEDAIRRRVPFVIPIGTIEYHAYHASCGCDTLTVSGIIERLERERELVLCPPVWYGAVSNAAGGPEKSTVDIGANTYEEYVHDILKAMFYGGNRNIYCVFHHASEGRGLKTLSLCCMKAATRVINEYLESKYGNGWWADDSFDTGYKKEFGIGDLYDCIKVVQLLDKRAQERCEGFDHAGKYETSLLMALYPKKVDLARTRLNKDWFAAEAGAASAGLGEEMIEIALDSLRDTIV